MTVSTTPRVFCQAEISLRKNPMYLLVIMFCSWTWMGWVDGMGGDCGSMMHNTMCSSSCSAAGPVAWIDLSNCSPATRNGFLGNKI